MCAFPALIAISKPRTIIGIPRTTVYELARRGQLELKKVDGRTYITRGSFERFLEQLPDVRPRQRPTPKHGRHA